MDMCREDFPLKDSYVDGFIIAFMVSCVVAFLSFAYYFPIPVLTLIGWYYWFHTKNFPANLVDNYKVAIIGTGFSGLNAAIECKNAGIPFVVFERNSEIGGTWWENTYLGCECDVASHLYSFSFELNPNWSRKFSNQREILQYMKHCVQKYGLSENIRLKHKVTCGTWDEKNAVWVVEYENANGEKCVENFRFIIAGTGPLNRPNTPMEFQEGLRTFRGQCFHTAQWDGDCDLKGKRVAVIGSAASALQVVPHLCNIAAETFVFQRTPNWIFPKENYSYSNVAKAMFAYVPFAMRFYRWYIYFHNESLFWLLFSGGWRNEKVRELVQKFLVGYFQDAKLANSFTPTYEIGCKRILLSDNLGMVLFVYLVMFLFGCNILFIG
jgi:cation diffusion facilitator CzcD-associated flavoprotein CzcO